MKVEITYLNCEATRDRRPEKRSDYMQDDTLDARFNLSFTAVSPLDIYRKLCEELVMFDDDLDDINTLELLAVILEENNEDPSAGNDLIESVTIDDEVIFQDDAVSDLIDSVNEDLENDDGDFDDDEDFDDADDVFGDDDTEEDEDDDDYFEADED